MELILNCAWGYLCHSVTPLRCTSLYDWRGSKLWASVPVVKTERFAPIEVSPFVMSYGISGSVFNPPAESLGIHSLCSGYRQQSFGCNGLCASRVSAVAGCEEALTPSPSLPGVRLLAAHLSTVTWSMWSRHVGCPRGSEPLGCASIVQPLAAHAPSLRWSSNRWGKGQGAAQRAMPTSNVSQLTQMLLI